MVASVDFVDAFLRAQCFLLSLITCTHFNSFSGFTHCIHLAHISDATFIWNISFLVPSSAQNYPLPVCFSRLQVL